MKIIINTSNLYTGGGLQVAISFVNELKLFNKNHIYYVFLSPEVKKQIDQESFSENFCFYLIEKSPSSLKVRKEVVAKMSALEEQIKPDVIFSVFGPMYWRPKAKHIMGFALPWMINPASIVYDRLPFFDLIKMRMLNVYKKHYVKNDADFYIVETDDVKSKLINLTSLDRDSIFIVGNTHSSVFNLKKFQYFPMSEKSDREFRFITITSYKPHKNLQIIRDIIPLLKEQNVKFYLTINEEVFERLFSGMEMEGMVVNLGSVESVECPSIYRQCDALFLPTLLECFSASYPEAMKMKKPIITSNYSFAKDICGDAALYFDPLDPEDIAEKIKQFLADKSFQNNLIKKGEKRVNEFETARSRAEKYIELCELIVETNKENENV